MNKGDNVSLLEVDNLSVSFSDGVPPALSSVGFTLSKNEILGIVGETGAGKSVLARALINLLPKGGAVTSGDVRIGGRSIIGMSPQELRQLRGGRIALIGTNAKALLDPVQRVGEQVARVLMAHRGVSKRAAWQAAIDLLGSVGINDPEQRSRAYPHQMSGGMAQRVIIAMALIAEPEVLLADDATLGLDATIQVQVLELLVKKCRELGLAVVLISHDLGIIAQYCERVAVMRRGKIVELNTVKRFLEGPEQPYSAQLLDAAKVRPTPMPAKLKEDEAPTTDGSLALSPLVRVQNLIKVFPISGTRDVVRAVDDVSFSIGRGETLALVGESGSGKTTVGQCLVRLLPPDQGRILFDGEEVTAMSEGQFIGLRHRIQMVFQEPYVALNPRWSVQDLISEPLALVGRLSRQQRRQRVASLLDSVELPASIAMDYPHQLTAGEQKRIGIARALATNPHFVVFDEPTTALDIRVRAQIIDLIRNLQAQMGLTALFITHDLNSVRSLSHYVAVMQHGKIVEHGPTETIFSSPKKEYTKALLSAELPVEERGVRLGESHAGTALEGMA